MSVQTQNQLPNQQVKLQENYWVDAAATLRTVLGADFDINTHKPAALQVIAGQSFANMSPNNFHSVLVVLRELERRSAILK